MTHPRPIMRILANRGFIGAGVAMAFAAGLMAMYTAWGFTRTIGITSDNQRLIHSKTQLERLVQDISATSTRKPNDVIIWPPPMAVVNHGGGAATMAWPASSSNAVVNTVSQNGTPPVAAGFLPSGFSPRKAVGEIRYIPFFYPQTAGETRVGYVLGDTIPGLPKPNDVAFALISTGNDGRFNTTIGDARIGLARGDDIVAYATVGQVNGENYRQLIDRAGNIPDCGYDPVTKKVTALRWDKTTMEWTCLDTEIKSHSVSGSSDSVDGCPAGNALAVRIITNADGSQSRRMECMTTDVPHGWSRFGSIMDAAGNLQGLLDARLAYGNLPFCGLSGLDWVSYNGISDFKLQSLETGNRNGFSAQLMYRCNGNPTVRQNNITTGCLVGEVLAADINANVTCAKLDWEPNAPQAAQNLAGFSTRMRLQMTENISAGLPLFQSRDYSLAFYMNGRIYGFESQSYDLCAAGYRPAIRPGYGLGCYLLNDPKMGWGTYEDTAIHFADRTCPSGTVMRITGNAQSNRTECVSVDDVLASVMPTAACPDSADTRLNRGQGALTWNAETKRFSCSFVDRCNPLGKNRGLVCPE